MFDDSSVRGLVVPSTTPLLDESAHQLFVEREDEHCYLNYLMGEYLPTSLPERPFEAILDVHCRSGEWLLKVARRYPEARCVGIDTSFDYIERARARARALPNVSFLVKDYETLDTALAQPCRFDLVHLSFCATNPLIKRVSKLLHTLVELCRPGGYLLWHEAELPVTTGLSCQHFFSTLIAKAMQMQRKEDEAGRTSSVTAQMACWLRHYGCCIVDDGALVVDASKDMPMNRHFARHFQVLSQQMKDLILLSGLIWERAYDGLCRQALNEIQADHFCAICFARALLVRRED